MARAGMLRIPLAELEEPAAILRSKISPDSIRELAQSLEKAGQLQPILVRRHNGHYRIIAGHRRALAARSLRWSHISAIEVSDTAVPDTMLAITENTAREQLTPLEESSLLHDLVITQNYDLDQVCKTFGHSRAWGEARLDLYDYPEEIKRHIHEGTLSLAVGKELSKITDKGYRAYLVEQAAGNGCTLRVATMWRQEWESRGNPEMQYNPDAQNGVEYTPPPAAGLQCSSCGELTDLRLLTTLHVCRTCMTAQGGQTK